MKKYGTPEESPGTHPPLTGAVKAADLTILERLTNLENTQPPVHDQIQNLRNRLEELERAVGVGIAGRRS